jgi:hypothetical protein
VSRRIHWTKAEYPGLIYYRGLGLPPPGFIDAPWWYVVGAELRAEELTRRAWLDELIGRWGLVVRADAR